MLTNSEMDSASPFAGILVGQPTLNRQLRMGMFAALDQRIATRFTIKPMDLAESAAYLRHHLALAGREEPLFADDAVARLHRVSNGLPRALNNAATAALIAAAARQQGPRRRRLRQEGRRRTHPGLTMPGDTCTAPPHPPPAPAPRRRAAAPVTFMTPAVAARVRQLAAQAEHRRAIAEFRARHVADQQARVNALLLETVAALASLLSAPASQAHPACPHPKRRRTARRPGPVTDTDPGPATPQP